MPTIFSDVLLLIVQSFTHACADLLFLEFGHVRDKFFLHCDRRLFFIHDIVIHDTFRFGKHDSHLDRLGLPEAPKPPNRLIVRFPRVIHSDKDHTARLLKVHSKTGNAGLCD